MTTISQTCTEMLHAQAGLQQVAHAQRRLHHVRELNTPANRAEVAQQQGFCGMVLDAAAARLTRFAAANDNTMVMGVA